MIIDRLDNILKCKIIRRINRFVVRVDIDGHFDEAHLANTGRLHDILVKDKNCIIQEIEGKKLRYRVIGVEDMRGYSIIDTLTQNKVFETLINRSILPYLNICSIIKRNPKVDSETFDYLLKCDGKLVIIETKSAVLRNKYRALYPDCPTIRGRRQINKLIKLRYKGLETWLIFIAALPQIRCFEPYENGDPIVFQLISKALLKGVNIKALSIYMDEEGRIYLENPDLPLCEEWLKRIK